jgi:hypothetical protein
MAAHHDRAEANGGSDAVMRSFVRGTVAQKPEYARTTEGGEVCRLVVIGGAGPASKPARVSLYIRNGAASTEGLRSDEAHRCAFGLRAGDVIQAVGDIGPERRRAPRQEVIVSEPVRLRARAAEAAGAA